MNPSLKKLGTWEVPCVALLLVAPWLAHAGLPEPDLVLFGKVKTVDQTLLTDGSLEWRYIAEDGRTITVESDLFLVEENGDSFSYSVEFPCETAGINAPVSPDAIPLSQTPLNFERSLVWKTPGQFDYQVYVRGPAATAISAANRGDITRLDLVVGEWTWGDVGGGLYGSSLDVPCDGSPGGLDSALLLQWYVGAIDTLRSCGDSFDYFFPEHPPGADVNGDGFLGGLDASDVLKFNAGLIDCFAVNCLDEKTVASRPARSKYAGKEKLLSLPQDLFVPDVGGRVRVPVELNDGSEVESFRLEVAYPAEQLRLVEAVPASGTHAWSAPAGFSEAGRVVLAAASPTAMQSAGPIAELEFEVLAPLNARQEFGGLTELNDGYIPVTLAGGFLTSDTDSDGIADHLDGAGDFDGDGVPNYRDEDADGDGIPDQAEGAEDVDADGRPNFLDLDSDGDGATDEEEYAAGNDPYVHGVATGMPLRVHHVVCLLVMALGVLRLRRNRHNASGVQA